ncbi:MAG: complex I subunit 1 family protein [Halococcoides sp.]
MTTLPAIAEGAFAILIFPGLAFAVGYGLFAEFLDRKVTARLQNRVGPGPTQPIADYLKLFANESIVPEDATGSVFRIAPLVAFAAVLTAILYVPTYASTAAAAFEGDLVVVLALLAVPSVALVFGGWHSGNAFSRIGTHRTLTQLFGYEVPFFLACLAPAIAAGSWSISGVTAYVGSHPLYIVALVPGLVVALTGLQAKLERVPFDIPKAKTELAGGPTVEYSGRKLAFLELTKDVEFVVGAALIAALFLGGPAPAGAIATLVGGSTTTAAAATIAAGLAVFLVKTLAVVATLSVAAAVVARLRIEQMVRLNLTWLLGLAICQIAIAIALATFEVIP